MKKRETKSKHFFTETKKIFWSLAILICILGSMTIYILPFQSARVPAHLPPVTQRAAAQIKLTLQSITNQIKTTLQTLGSVFTTKRAQSALEFLTTYGWAFLVILIMISALSYFGVLDPSRMLPDKCIFGTGIGACQDSNAYANAIVLKVQNNYGTPLNITSATATITGLTNSGSCTGFILNGNTTSGATVAYNLSTLAPLWNPSTSMFFNISLQGCTIGIGERPSATVNLYYTPLGKSFTQSNSGVISIKRTQ